MRNDQEFDPEIHNLIATAMERADDPGSCRNDACDKADTHMRVVGMLPLPLRHLENLVIDLCEARANSDDAYTRDFTRRRHIAVANIFRDKVYESMSIPKDKIFTLSVDWKVAVVN